MHTGCFLFLRRIILQMISLVCKPIIHNKCPSKYRKSIQFDCKSYWTKLAKNTYRFRNGDQQPFPNKCEWFENFYGETLVLGRAPLRYGWVLEKTERRARPQRHANRPGWLKWSLFHPYLLCRFNFLRDLQRRYVYKLKPKFLPNFFNISRHRSKCEMRAS